MCRWRQLYLMRYSSCKTDNCLRRTALHSRIPMIAPRAEFNHGEKEPTMMIDGRVAKSAAVLHLVLHAIMLRPVSCLLLFLLQLLLPRLSYCWGTIGHEIVANVAWRQLSNHTREWVQEILELNDTDASGNSPLGQVADWADRVRHFLPWSAPLHYIDVRDDIILPQGCHVASSASGIMRMNPQCHFDYARDCPDHTCVAGAIVNYTQQLLQQSASSSSSFLRGRHPSPESYSNDIPLKKEALMFLTHFIGDIHQPLHCSRTTDKGGNEFHVHFTPLPPPPDSLLQQQRISRQTNNHHSGWNLHSVWDTGLIDVALERNYNQSRTMLEDDLYQQPLVLLDDDVSASNECGPDSIHNCTILWGQESWNMAIHYAYTMDDNATDVVDGATLDEGYYETRWPLAKERLRAGAVRLASTIEWIAAQQPKQNLQVRANHRQPPVGSTTSY